MKMQLKLYENVLRIIFWRFLLMLLLHFFISSSILSLFAAGPSARADGNGDS